MSDICFRCGETDQFDGQCTGCGEKSVVRVVDLVDLVNDMYIHGELTIHNDGETNYLVRVFEDE